MSSPATLARLETGFDGEAWSAMEVHRPALALLSRREYLGLLLARDSEATAEGTILRGVQWIRLPLGWRWSLLVRLGRYLRLRTPEEWLFNEVALVLAANGMFVARLSGDARRPLILPEPSDCPYPLRQLTARQYHLLASAGARLLRAQVTALFHEHLGVNGERTALRMLPHWPGTVLPWRVFPG